jgi:hypothetical protein
VSGQPQPHTFCPQKLVTRQGQVLGVTRRALGEEPARTAYVREEADAGFRHGHAGGLGGHDEVRPGGQAQAAAHSDAAGQNHHRLGGLVDHQVQGILLPEELVGQVYLPGLYRPGQFLEVAPGAETALPGSANYHQTDFVRSQRGFQSLGQEPDHLAIEGVEDPRAVEDQGHQAGIPDYENRGLGWIGHIYGLGFRGQ